ncbi:DEHA2G11539p protein [Puccinia sorghi]|uniref:DEHA2G11539p protein n=1 Tax=Puccinia sorghi TaxID=27349 RepID=A0A0L6UQA3_9BASI|nr:DEHA2G11539p protein [Puccinia sorghi]
MKVGSFWWYQAAEAVNTATNFSNLAPSITRHRSIPYNTWTGRSVNWDILRTFGFLTYPLIPNEIRNFKLNRTAERGKILGYKNKFSSYCILNLEARKVVRIRDVKFEEFTFPGLNQVKNPEELDAYKIFDWPKRTLEQPLELPLPNESNT